MIRPLFLFTGFLISTFPKLSLGCAVCYGDPNAPMTAGLNQAIFFLLGVIGIILSLILSAGIYFYKRAKTYNTPGIKR